MKEIHVFGSSLFEYSAPTVQSQNVLKTCDLILGEHSRVTQTRLKAIDLKPSCQIFNLDNLKEPDKKFIQAKFHELSQKGGRIGLFSDMGMPLLFDPGTEWVELALSLGFRLRCEAGPTSWGTACALSLWEPPFFIQGFLSQKTDLRLQQLTTLRSISAHIVLMDTPYRFKSLLRACEEIFGAKQLAFLAWEISSKSEYYFWDTLSELQQSTLKKGLIKGEFILILKNPSLVK